MSIHTSLRISQAGAKHRNVLKRHERVRRLAAEERWSDEHSVFHLPKVKSIKIKAKGKAAKAKEEAVGGAAAPEATAPAAAAKPTATAKPAAAAKPAQKPAAK